MNLMSAVFAPGRSTVERGRPFTAGTVVVEEAVDEVPFCVTQTLRRARFVHTCTWDPTFRTAPILVQATLAAGFSVAALGAGPTTIEPEATARPTLITFANVMWRRAAITPALPTDALPHW